MDDFGTSIVGEPNKGGGFAPPSMYGNSGFAPPKGYGKGKGKGAGKGIGGKGAPSPQLLTANIKNAQTLEELFRTVAAYEGSFNHIHLSACWNSLGHQVRAASVTWHQEHALTLASLVRHTTRIVSSSSEIRARELANIAHGVAKSGRGSEMGELMTALARSIERRVGDCNAQELANTAWAFAKVGQLDAVLFAALARAAERHMDSFKAQELANTAWAFATAGVSAGPLSLFVALARAAERRLADFNVQGLSNTVWAFAKAGHADAPLLRSMAKMSMQRLGEFNAQDLAHTAWAFAKLGVDAELFAALAGVAERHLDSFNAQGLANTVWAFAKAGSLDATLFAAFAKSAERRLGEFNAQDLANTAWAFAKACHLDAQLFGALARATERCLDDFNAQDLVNTAWAFAKLGHSDVELFVAVARSLASRSLQELNAPHMANIAWAFAKAGQLDGPLFAALARSAEQRVGDFSAGDLATIAWAFANAGQMDAKLFASLARAADSFLEEFTEEALDNAEWAFAKAGEQKIVKSLRQRRKRTSGAAAALASQEVDVSRVGRIVVAGGGIGGAAVAVALQRKGFDVVVLEADRSFDARKQGYGLTIQRQDATQAMGINLSTDDAPSTSHYTFDAEGNVLGFYGEVGNIRTYDDSGCRDRDLPSASVTAACLPCRYACHAATRAMLLRLPCCDARHAAAPANATRTIHTHTQAFGSKSKDRKECENSGRFVHIPRQMLRARIVEQVRPGTIRWNSKLKSFKCWGESDEEDCVGKERVSGRDGASSARRKKMKNGVTATLTDGTTIDAALLVGSDGIFSTVRQQLSLPGDRLNYVGLIVVLGIMESRYPRRGSKPA